MRKLLITAAIAATAALSASAASATVFTLDSFTVTAQSGDPGLVVQIDPLLASTTIITSASSTTSSYQVTLDTPLSLDLLATNPQYANLFKLYTDESTVNKGEDTVPDNITVSFDFSTPSPNSGASVSGDTFGVLTLGGLIQNGAVTWSGPGDFTWGDGGSMLITLNPPKHLGGPEGGTFNTGLGGLSGDENKGLVVKAEFDWQSDPTGAVPEPASWALMIGGFGMAGAMLRRRKAVAATA